MVGGEVDNASRSGDETGESVEMPHRPVGVTVDRCEIRKTTEQQRTFDERRIVEAGVRQRDVFHAVLLEPRPVVGGIKTLIVIEHGVEADIQLAFAAPGERHVEGGAHRLPLPVGRWDLDASL